MTLEQRIEALEMEVSELKRQATDACNVTADMQNVISKVACEVREKAAIKKAADIDDKYYDKLRDKLLDNAVTLTLDSRP